MKEEITEAKVSDFSEVIDLIEIFIFLICAVVLWVLRPLLAYCTSPR
jgi:hypothetical protein